MNAYFDQFLPHLIELRKRIIYTFLIIFCLFLICFYYDEILYNFIAKPILKALPPGSQLIATEVTSTFTVPMKLAFMTSLYISIPYLLYQIWSFVAPGLYKHEKYPIFFLILMSSILFYTGALFSFFVIIPLALQFFTHIAPPSVAVMTDIRDYLDFVLTLLFSGGIAFQVPVITLVLLQTGIVTITMLAHFRPYIIVAAFVIGMILTPPDVVSQILLAVPMWLLFELGLLLAKARNQKT